VIVSQHIGDLDTLEARVAFERAIDDLCWLYDFKPELIACDLHPDYASTQWARRSGLPVVAVQHHQAHVASCAAENDVRGPYLGFGWDGTGFGGDGTIWGGEAFLADGARFERVAHLRTFRLPGGEAAIREGWRSAASLLWTLGIEMDARARRLAPLLDKGLNAPLTSSVGRLFDAASALAGLAQESRFEGQAAMLLEREIGSLETGESYTLAGGDWEPLIRALLDDVRRGTPAQLVAARFHNALARWIVEEALRSGLRQVVLSGGVFQNRYLTERAAALLEARGFAVYTHQRVPANDGGIALGQAVLAASAR
jgi:hydrogenase maturation protein HypF